MSRVLLITPPTLFPTSAPPLGVSYLASALLRGGHDVRALDLSARYGPGPDAVAEMIKTWEPHLVGVSVYTDTALAAYDLVRDYCGEAALLVAGGPHPTAVPEEALRYGFHVVVSGEGEYTLSELATRAADRHGGTRGLEEIPGLTFLDGSGVIKRTETRKQEELLDRLPPPHEAWPLFDRAWYLPGGQGIIPTTLITSRGCPGACTFCANIVTGRRHRSHSADRVIAEIKAQLKDQQAAVFSIHDDAFTASPEKAIELCRRMESELSPPPIWWCESRVDSFTPALAAAMRSAGCVSVVFGVESGSQAVLRRIGKRITPAQVVSALEAATAAGLMSIVNMMFGFPGETAGELAQTRAFMERIAPLVTSFNQLGVLIPLPGTAIYRIHAREYNFEDWWLDRDRLDTLYGPVPAAGFNELPPGRWPTLQAELEEAALAADFFHYSAKVKEAIRTCLKVRRRLSRPGT